MELLIFFGIMFLLMLIDNSNIKKDIKATSKIKFTNRDAYNYYKNYNL